MKRLAIPALLLLLSVSIWKYWQYSTDYVGVDYYQYWMVGEYSKHKEPERVDFYASEKEIGSYLYYDTVSGLKDRYGTHILLADIDRLPYIMRKEDRKLFNASRIRREPRFYSTPFLYYFVNLFSLKDYSASFKLFSSVSLLSQAAPSCLNCSSFLLGCLR